jgi:hypothetical protein
LANAKNGKDCAQRAFDAKSRMMVRIDLTLRIYHILGGLLVPLFRTGLDSTFQFQVIISKYLLGLSFFKN